jgi:hypothetical protein
MASSCQLTGRTGTVVSHCRLTFERGGLGNVGDEGEIIIIVRGHPCEDAVHCTRYLDCELSK